MTLEPKSTQQPKLPKLPSGSYDMQVWEEHLGWQAP